MCPLLLSWLVAEEVGGEAGRCNEVKAGTDDNFKKGLLGTGGRSRAAPKMWEVLRSNICVESANATRAVVQHAFAFERRESHPKPTLFV